MHKYRLLKKKYENAYVVTAKNLISLMKTVYDLAWTVYWWSPQCGTNFLRVYDEHGKVINRKCIAKTTL